MTRRIASFRANSREHAASITVAALSGGFGVFLLQITAMLSVYVNHQNVAQHDTAQAALAILTVVFTAIAMYVGAIVTTNTFATIIAGRRRSIALMRLIGATASTIRQSVANEGLIVGIIGALIGVVVGVALSLGVLAVLLRTSVIPSSANVISWGMPLLPRRRTKNVPESGSARASPGANAGVPRTPTKVCATGWESPMR